MYTSRVLLVEDRESDAHVLKVMLSGSNGYSFKVDWANSLDIAFRSLNRRKYDVILLSAELPGNEGLEALTRLSGEVFSVPVIALTRRECELTGIELVRAGAQDYLSKERLSSDFLRQSIIYAIERQKIFDRVISDSIRDELTGLYNRRGFIAITGKQLKLISREKMPASMLFIDLDNLKQINDYHGHHHGDRAIIESPHTIRSLFRESDILGRVGGDEFAIFAPNANKEIAEVLAARLGNTLEKRNSNGSLYPINMSVGIASYNTKKNYEVQELLNRADLLMYEHKNGKRNGQTAFASVSQQLA